MEKSMDKEQKVFKLKVQKINPDAVIPSYAHDGDAGMDLISVEDLTIMPSESALIHTGLKIQLPENTEAQVRPRSGLALNHKITVLNSPGTIDEGYRGEIMIILINHGKMPFEVKKGMKIAQMVIKPIIRVKIEEVSALNVSDRSENGFGSSGFYL